MVRAVIDTNVLFAGVTAPAGAEGFVVAAWLQQLFVPCVSTAVALEYEEVLGCKLRPERAQVALLLLRELLRTADHIDIRWGVRPLSPDADDDFVIDCAFNAKACVVTENVRDFRAAERQYGIPVYTSEAFRTLLGGS